MESIPDITFSAAFVLIGSLVFYLAAFISGFNIYRKVNGQLAWIATLGVGFILFGLSPASYTLMCPFPKSDKAHSTVICATISDSDHRTEGPDHNAQSRKADSTPTPIGLLNELLRLNVLAPFF